MPKVAETLNFRCLHLIGLNKQTKLGAIFSLQEWLVQSYAARLFRNKFLNFVSNFSLEGGNWVVRLVALCFDNIFMVCWSLNLQKLVRQNLFFWILVPLGGGGIHACVGKVCYKYIVHILKSNKNSIFFAPTSNLCRAMLPKYFRTYSCALHQIKALEKAFKKPNNGQSLP